LISGCSSGIGAALAREFHRREQRVYASARRLEDLQPLAEEGIATLQLDVNDEMSISEALATIEAEAGHLDMLINNAGVSRIGTLVDLSRDDLRWQFETNVFAPISITGGALDMLRRAVARNGLATVVNVGSIVGLFSTPFAGAYCASKSALHALSDTLRMELAPFGIRVIQVQPGGVTSSFGKHCQENLRLPETSLYRELNAAIEARASASQQGATPAAQFAVLVADQLLNNTPPAVIRGGRGSRLLPLILSVLPRTVTDRLMGMRYGLARFRPGPPS